jgi:hypothetical protein
LKPNKKKGGQSEVQKKALVRLKVAEKTPGVLQEKD